MRTVAFCEIDPYCRAVLRKHWPDVPCFNDIRELDADRLDRLGSVDLICGGFPCQPFSVAGKQAAHADDRHLWPEMRRVIALARPAWVIGENVAGIVTLALDDVLADMEDLGYTARTFVIPACAVDAPHRRDRVWIVATDTIGHQLRDEPGRRGGKNGAGQTKLGDDGAAGIVADADLARLEGRDCGSLSERASERAAWASGASTDPDREQMERLAEPRQERCQWLPEPDVGRVAHGIPSRTHRLRALGNAVVPAIPEILGHAIIQAEKERC